MKVTQNPHKLAAGGTDLLFTFNYFSFSLFSQKPPILRLLLNFLSEIDKRLREESEKREKIINGIN